MKTLGLEPAAACSWILPPGMGNGYGNGANPNSPTEGGLQAIKRFALDG